MEYDSGYNGGPSRQSGGHPGGPPARVQPIAVPSLSLDEIREVTRNYSNESLIGEGSYARVYYGALRNGRKAAIKKLDTSKQPDQEFLAQVNHLFIYIFLVQCLSSVYEI